MESLVIVRRDFLISLLSAEHSDPPVTWGKGHARGCAPAMSTPTPNSPSGIARWCGMRAQDV